MADDAPAVVLPDPAVVFHRRAERFRALAADHPMAPYLTFLADLAQVQHDLQADLPPVITMAEAALARSIAHQMPVISRPHVAPDPVMTETIRRVVAGAGTVAMPPQAETARLRLDAVLAARATDLAGPDRSEAALTLRGVVDAVLNDAIPADALAEHVLAGAALEVHFARLAASLPAGRLRYIGDHVCPFCGGWPASSAIVGSAGVDKLRYCTCALCATRWNAVRVKCLACSSTKGIHYQAIEGVAQTIKAECCDECLSYVKIMAEDEAPGLDPIADDVASLGLDLMVREAGYRRAGVNLYLLGT